MNKPTAIVLAAAALLTVGITSAVAQPDPAPVPTRNESVIPLDAWRANLRAEGFTQVDPETFAIHGECWAVAPDGDTAVLVCRDGYAAVS